MGYYIVGLLKSKTYKVEGYVLLDSGNNDRISIVSRDNLMANMEKDDDLIVNAKLTSRGVSGSAYSLSSLSSIIITEKKRRIVDNGVLAVYPVDMHSSPSGIGYRCFRLRLDVMKSDIGTGARESLMDPAVQLINKINDSIVTGYDAKYDYVNKRLGMTKPLQGLAGREKSLKENNQTQIENKSDNDKKLDAMLERLRPGLEASGQRHSHEELVKLLEAKMLNPHVDVSYDEFRFYMLMKGWDYTAKYLSANTAEGIELFNIDPKCKVLHVPSNVVSLHFEDTEQRSKPVNYDFDFFYINNDKIYNIEYPSSSGAANSSFRFGVLAFGGHEKTYTGVSIGNRYVRIKVDIGTLIFNKAITEIKDLSCCTVEQVDLSNITRIENSFNGTKFGVVPKLGDDTRYIVSSFNDSNILTNQTLENLHLLTSMNASLCNCATMCDTLRLNSQVLSSITASFSNMNVIRHVDLSLCPKLLRINDCFNQNNIESILLPVVDVESSEAYKKDDWSMQFRLTDSFDNFVGSTVDLPLHTVTFSNCFKYSTQDIRINIYPNKRTYGSTSSSIYNIGVDYLLGYKHNFKFSLENFDIPKGYFPIKRESLSNIYYDNAELDALRKMDVKDFVPRNSVFGTMSLAGADIGIFDTADFYLMDRLRTNIFGDIKKDGRNCKINTLIINKNILSITESAFAGIGEVRNLYISPNIQKIDAKAFNKHNIKSVCNTYLVKDSEAYKILKNKRGFNIILIDDFDKAVEEAKETLTAVSAVPAKFKMLLSNSPLYSRLLDSKYADNIKELYGYLSSLHNGTSTSVTDGLPGLDTSRWSDIQHRTNCAHNSLLKLIIDSQIACTSKYEDSKQAERIFTGLNNMFTTVLGDSDTVLTATSSLEKISYFYATKLKRKLRYNSVVTVAEWGEYLTKMQADTRDLQDLAYKSHKTEVAEKLEEARREYIKKYKNSPYDDSSMLRLVLDMDIDNANKDGCWANDNRSLIGAFSGLDIKVVYSDNNRNAIFTLVVDGNRVDPDTCYSGVYSERFEILVIVHNGEVVWARPLLMSESYKQRFEVNYNNINRYNHNCTYIIKPGDLFTSKDSHIIGGIEVDDGLLNPVIIHTLKELSSDSVKSIIDLARYNITTSYDSNDQNIMRLFKCALFPIGGRERKGKFCTQLFYDMFMQRFYEIESYAEVLRNDSIGKHLDHSNFSSMRILNVWDLKDINLIPEEYFSILRIDSKTRIHDLADTDKAFYTYESFKFNNSDSDLHSKLTDPRMYVRNNDQNSVLIQLADSLGDKIGTAKPTVKMFDVIEKAGLMAKFRTKPASFAHMTLFTTLRNIQLDSETALRELIVHNSLDRHRNPITPDYLIDTGKLKKSSQKVLMDGNTSDVLFLNYVYYHDTPGMYSDKIRSFYTSLMSLDETVELLKGIKSARAKGFRGLGDLSNDPNKYIVSRSQIKPIYCVKGMKIMYDFVTGKNYDYYQIEYITDLTNKIMYSIEIGVDLGNGDIYTVAVEGDKVIVLFRHDDLKSAAMFQELLLRSRNGWAKLCYGLTHGLKAEDCGDLMVIRDLIINGYYSDLPFITPVIKELTGVTTEAAESVVRRIPAQVLNLITKQMKQ